MAIAFTNSTYDDVAPSKSHSFFGKLFSSMIAARERQAKRYVNGYLLGLEDDQLSDLGYTRAELEQEGVARFPY